VVEACRHAVPPEHTSEKDILDLVLSMHPSNQHNTWNMDHATPKASEQGRTEEIQNMHSMNDDVDRNLASVLNVRLLLLSFVSDGYLHCLWAMVYHSFSLPLVCKHYVLRKPLLQVYNSRATPYEQVPRGVLDVGIRTERAERGVHLALPAEEPQVKPQDLILVGPQKRLVQVWLWLSNVGRHDHRSRLEHSLRIYTL
jgi:hypothetical protein